MDDALAAFGLVFLAELGDKSMLLAVALAARYRPAPVLGGIAIAAATMLGVAALVGGAVGTALPDRAMSLVGGLLFLGFGIWTLRGDEEEDEQAELRGRSVLLGVTGAFLVAEFGDKTMLATAALASTNTVLPTWLGASVGMAAASGLAIALTVLLGAKLPQRTVRFVAAGGFLLFGALLLVDALRG